MKEYDWYLHQNAHPTECGDGLEIRDYFAAHIMTHFGWAKTAAGDTRYDKVNSERCYEIADAMMKARGQ